MTTRKITGFASHVLLLALVSALSFSQAASAGPCSAEIDALRAKLSDICWYGRKCYGLSHKLDRTERKLKKRKFRHAARKLSDFGWVVEGMAMRRKPKISRADYHALMNPYYVAVADCIANGGISTTPVGDDTGAGDDTGTDIGGDDTGTDTGGAEPPPVITVPF